MKNLNTVSTFFDKRATKKGEGIIKIVITSNRVQRLYTTKIKMLEIEWEKLNSSISKNGLNGRIREQKIIDIYNSLYNEENLDKKQLEGFVTKAKKICNELGKEFSFEKFKIKFEDKSKSGFFNENSKDVFSFFDKKIRQMYTENRVGNAISYTSSKNSILKFCKSISNILKIEFDIEINKKADSEIKLSFEKVSLKFLNEYESWMLHSGKMNQKGLNNDSPASFTTLGIYLRQLRAIFNDAISEKITLNYPFGKNGYTIKKGQNVKKAINKSEIIKILNFVPTEGIFEKRSHDFWILSYLCSGMNFTDLLRLKKKNINLEEGKLVFVREKTKRTNKYDKKEIRLVISERAVEIVKNWIDPTKTEYLFPFLTKHMSEIDKKKKITQFQNSMSNPLILVFGGICT